MSQDARFDEEQSTMRRAQVIGMPYVDVSQIQNKILFPEVLEISEMYQIRVVPLDSQSHSLTLGVTTITSQNTMKQLAQRFLDQKLTFAIISETGYNDYMKLYDPPKKIVYQDVALTGAQDDVKFDQISATLDTVRADDILGYLVKQSYQLKASDIHIENEEEYVRVRFRVDGVLHSIASFKREKYRQLLSAIAIAANVSTGSPEAQTGHINKDYTLATGETVRVNLRVETIPTVYGIDVVMRLFNMKMELLNLDNLGLLPNERANVDDVINHPTGMVLAVGPTGSGKTTTLYSLLNTLNTDERKIITLEDPVEYNIKGIVQVPVDGDSNPKAFAEKLRAVLRLDPDVVMIGEIRDQDTAKTALQAALTGHLVLSTYHASSAAAALTRMLDSVGINPLFSSAMHLVMAQRLIRKLDESTKVAYQPDDGLRAQLQLVIDTLPPRVDRPSLDNITLYKAGGSESNPFGYQGQIAIREQLMMTPGVQQLLRLPPQQISTEMLEAKAIEEGMLTMLQNGVLKILEGVTTIEEVYRVVG